MRPQGSTSHRKLFSSLSLKVGSGTSPPPPSCSHGVTGAQEEACTTIWRVGAGTTSQFLSYTSDLVHSPPKLSPLHAERGPELSPSTFSWQWATCSKCHDCCGRPGKDQELVVGGLGTQLRGLAWGPTLGTMRKQILSTGAPLGVAHTPINNKPTVCHAPLPFPERTLAAGRRHCPKP